MAVRESRRQNHRYFDFSLLQPRRPTRRPPPPTAICEVVLPRDVHTRILGHLEALHKDLLEPSCHTCLARDLSSYSKVCMEWHAAAVPHLFVTTMSPRDIPGLGANKFQIIDTVRYSLREPIRLSLRSG